MNIRSGHISYATWNSLRTILYLQHGAYNSSRRSFFLCFTIGATAGDLLKKSVFTDSATRHLSPFASNIAPRSPVHLHPFAQRWVYNSEHGTASDETSGHQQSKCLSGRFKRRGRVGSYYDARRIIHPSNTV